MRKLKLRECRSVCVQIANISHWFCLKYRDTWQVTVNFTNPLYAAGFCVIPVQLTEHHALSPYIPVSITVRLPITGVYLCKEISLFKNRFLYSEGFIWGKAPYSDPVGICRDKQGHVKETDSKQFQEIRWLGPLNGEAWFRSQVSSCGIRDGWSALWLVFLIVRPFCPVIIISPTLCSVFSQYFSFPLPVPFHHCSILIRLPKISK